MRRDSISTDRSDNFERRLRETMDTESDPEMFTPNTAGSEEFPEGDECFPLVEQFRQTNMKGGSARRGSSTSGRGRDQS